MHYIARAAGIFRNHQELQLEVRDPPYNMAVNIRVKVHPVVLFQIADAYERRDMEKYRVIGTLLGKYHNHIQGVVVVRNYPVSV